MQEEPRVLPARVPNLLVNGSSGIAVSIATKIPPHNLREVVAGLHALIDSPDITIAELMQHIPAPDFPTGMLCIPFNMIAWALSDPICVTGCHSTNNPLIQEHQCPCAGASSAQEPQLDCIFVRHYRPLRQDH